MFVFTMLMIRRGNKFFTSKGEWGSNKTELGKMRRKMSTGKTQEQKAKKPNQAKPLKEERNFHEEPHFDGTEREKGESISDMVKQNC